MPDTNLTLAPTASAAAAWAAMRAARPLVLCVTNRVTPQRVADLLLAAGASPAMADNPAELAQFAAIAHALSLNTGLHQTQPASLAAAADAIVALAKPAVLDPVGAGATPYRSAQIADLLGRARFSAIRGNASEIMALAGTGAGARGVDATDEADAARDAAVALARRHACVVAVSGPRDLITDGQRIARVGGGHPWLTRITGTGCALGALTAACAAASDPWPAAIAAHAAFALATNRAVPLAAGPGTLASHLADALAALEPDHLAAASITVETVDPDPSATEQPGAPT